MKEHFLQVTIIILLRPSLDLLHDPLMIFVVRMRKKAFWALMAALL